MNAGSGRTVHASYRRRVTRDCWERVGPVCGKTRCWGSILLRLKVTIRHCTRPLRNDRSGSRKRCIFVPPVQAPLSHPFAELWSA